MNGYLIFIIKRLKRKFRKVFCSGFFSDSSYFSVMYLIDVWEIKKFLFFLVKVKEINYF